MEIKPNRMVSLGYGKYWRSDAIVGLQPIEEDRGPGRRTEVYTATVDDPIVASRSEQAILHDMAIASDEHFRIQEAREMLVCFPQRRDWTWPSGNGGYGRSCKPIAPVLTSRTNSLPKPARLW
jgi:hypothetical protein